MKSAWRPVNRVGVAVLLSVGAATAWHGAGVAQTRVESAAAPAAPGEDWDTFRADVRIRRSRVTADGVPVGPTLPGIEYHWERRRSGARWKTTVTSKHGGLARVRALNGLTDLSHPLAAIRIEDDEDGTPIRFYNSRGQQIPWPSDDQLQRALRAPGPGGVHPQRPPLAQRPPSPVDASWANELVITSANRRDRLRAFSTQFGREDGRVRGLIRYIRSDGDSAHEVLVDPEQAVPVEMSVVRGGALVSRTCFAYSTPSNGSIIRQGMRTEEVVPDGGGDRLVAEVELANVKLERHGGAR